MSVLESPVLVLNRNWQAVNCCTVARALVLLWNENACVVTPEDYQQWSWKDWAKIDPADGDKFVQSTSLRVKVPEVIVLSDYDKLPSTAVTFSRRNLFKRDHYLCQYCGKNPNMEELTIDHIVPRCDGGETSWTNCVLACIKCNKKKDCKSLKASGLKLRKQPVKPDWKPVYAHRTATPESWKKFMSEVYWNMELQP